MSVKAYLPGEASLIDEWRRTHMVKRYSPGESSNWDDKPYKQRHSEMATKAAVHRLTRKAKSK